MAYSMFLCFLFFHFHFHFQATSSLSPNSSSSAILCPPHQSNALLLFKNYFSIAASASASSSYPKTNSWTEAKDCCLWDGVTCDIETGYVVGLDLSSGMLYGSIHSDNPLFSLSHLRKLDLFDNDFNSSNISSQFGYFINLTHLNLNYSNFAGEVPSEISHLSNLVSLDLSGNHVALEAITFNKIVQNLTKLGELSLNDVDMSMVAPLSLMNLSSSLSSLRLLNSSLRGEFPGSIIQLPNLQLLDLGDNEYLNGSLPMSNWSSSLRSLSLSSTKIPILLQPDFFSNLISLKRLRLSGCKFIGSNLELFGNLTELNRLDLSSNNFNGQIPSSFQNLKQLSHLILAYNNFRGQIPNYFANFTQLQILFLANNLLSGSVPSLPLLNLSYINLSYNLLNGTIPSSLFNLPSLVYSFLNDNQLHDSISQIRSNSLLQIDLRNNKFHGTIPNVQSNSLSYIDFSNNVLDGPISDSTFNVTNLNVLYLSSNNNLTGEISSSFCKLKYLEILDLSNNNFEGFIPPCILGNFSNSLSVLHFGMNSLKGAIPDTFSKSCGLKYVNFNGNQLEGRIPPSIINCRDLELVDFGNNKINDNFPHILGSLPQLEGLVMHSNNFHGSIESFNLSHSFPMLRIFDLSNNKFNGSLPAQYFDNFKAMMSLDREMRYMSIETYNYHYTVSLTLKGLKKDKLDNIQTILTFIDLSRNNFTGKIPESIGKLKSLVLLNLSHNCLTDDIPPSLANSTNLESLDLSSNFLSGKIPIQLVDLTFLQVFSVAHNQLEGLIPQGKQYNTFDKISYEGNLGLCGFPLGKCNNDGETQNQAPTEEGDSESGNGFGWKIVLSGYGGGLVFGIAIESLVIRTKKPAWFVRWLKKKETKGRTSTGRKKRRSHGKETNQGAND